MSVEFVDSNVLVYAYDRAAGSRHAQASALLRRLWTERSGVLSTQVLQEFYVNVTRKIPVPLSADQASQIIADLGGWSLVRPTVASLLAAIRLGSEAKVSFWDALILTAAREAGARIVWSEDLNDGQDYGGVVVRNPFS